MSAFFIRDNFGIRNGSCIDTHLVYASAPLGGANAYMFRPPVRSNGRSYKMLVMFLFFFRQVPSELPQLIALKLCHMIENWFD